MGAHVSEAPHSQTLRDTPLATRFNVAAFGCLGYELDLKYLSEVEKKEVEDQIAFYKKHRRLFQYGKFWRGEQFKDNKVVWHVVAKCEDREPSACCEETPVCCQAESHSPCAAISGFFQTQTTASEGFDRLRFMGLEAGKKYNVKTRTQRVFIERFGGLVKHLLPISLNPDGFVLRTANKHYSMNDCVESYNAYGEALMDGLLLNNQFEGTYYNENTRLLGDYGSNLYIVEEE
jgi:alpha-galactosidase